MVSMKAAAVALAVLVGALSGFYGGFHAGRGAAPKGASAVGAASSSLTAGRDGGTGTGGDGAAAAGGGGGFGGGAAGFAGGAGRGGGMGTITGLDAGGFTLHAANGDVKVLLGSGVTVRRTAAASPSDLQNDLTVTVAGQRNPDGTLAANAITILAPGTGGGG